MEAHTTKIEKISAVLFLLIGILTVGEYIFIQGMFTAPLMILLSVIIGIENIIVAAIHHKYMNLLFYLLLTAALNMGYLTLLGY